MLLRKVKDAYVLAALIVARLAMAALAIGLDWPPIPGHQGWYFHHGGDQDLYIAIGLSLVRQSPVFFPRYTVGFPLYTAPFLWLTNGDELSDILAPVVLFNVCLLAPASILLMYLAARQLTGQRGTALLSTALWTFLPYMVYAVGLPLELLRPTWGEMFKMWSGNYLWAHVLSDGPGTFVVMAFIYGLTRSLEPGAWRWVVLTGLLAGIGFLLRPVNILLFPVAGITYLWQKKLRQLVYFAVVAAFAASPQAMHDFFYGWSRSDLLEEQFSPRYAAETWARLSHGGSYPLVPFAIVLLAAAAGGIALWDIARRDKVGAGVLAAWILSYLVLYLNFYYLQHNVLRHLMPIAPAVMILLAIDILWFWRRLRPGPSPLPAAEVGAER